MLYLMKFASIFLFHIIRILSYLTMCLCLMFMLLFHLLLNHNEGRHNFVLVTNNVHHAIPTNVHPLNTCSIEQSQIMLLRDLLIIRLLILHLLLLQHRIPLILWLLEVRVVFLSLLSWLYSNIIIWCYVLIIKLKKSTR